MVGKSKKAGKSFVAFFEGTLEGEEMVGTKKVVVLASFPPPFAGQSIATQLLVEGLESDVSGEWNLEKLDFSESLGGDVPVARCFKLLKLCGRLFLVCAFEDVGLVYLQLGHGKFSIVRDSVFLSIAELFHRPALVHVHGSGYRDALDKMPYLVQKIARKLVSKCSGAIVLSKSLRCMFSNILEEDKIFVVENGINRDIEQASLHFERDYSNSSQGRRLNILFLSNLLEAKGYIELLEVAKRCFCEGLEVSFTFAGSKVEGARVDIEEYISEYGLDNTHYVGSVRGCARLKCYEEADIFVLPSEYEGQPLCILEAMHYGLPVISTKVGGIPDIFDGHEGAILVSPQDPQGLYDAIVRLARDSELRARMGRTNREMAQKKYTESHHVQRMLEIIRACK